MAYFASKLEEGVYKSELGLSDCLSPDLLVV